MPFDCIVTPRVARCLEKAGDAALLNDPTEMDEMADAMARIPAAEGVRARRLTWATSARRLLTASEGVFS